MTYSVVLHIPDCQAFAGLLLSGQITTTLFLFLNGYNIGVLKYVINKARK